MTQRFALHTVVGAVLVALLGSCSRSPLTGPPNLRVGHDECVACGMLISEVRSASAFLVARDGEREYLVFDDIGCMLDHQHDGLKNADVIERYVHDHPSQAWVDARTSTYLLTDPKSLPTPMGSGIAAFSNPADAAAQQSSKGGRVLNWNELISARRVWMEERYGKPASKGG